MTLRHMRVYLEVYQTGNITRAAERLHMTQPAVTRSIRELERYYGVCLFERLHHRLCVTEVGKTFFTYALHILDSFDHMEKELRDWDKFGVLRVGAGVTVGNVLLPELLAHFRQTHPHLRVRAMVANGAALQEALLDNRLDFAVIENSLSDERLCQERLFSDSLIPVLPPDDSRVGQEGLCLRDLAHEPLLLREEGSACRIFLDHVFALHSLSLEPTLESVSTQAILQAVHAGLGISFLPQALVLPHLQSGRVSTVRLADEAFQREIYLVWHTHKFLTPTTREMMSDLHGLCQRWQLFGQQKPR